jgi:hypothetical protein
VNSSDSKCSLICGLLVVSKRIVPDRVALEFLLENHGEGVALSVKVRYANSREHLQTTQNIIGPEQSTVINNVDPNVMASKGLQANYVSQDGRFFVTTIAYPSEQRTCCAASFGVELG